MAQVTISVDTSDPADIEVGKKVLASLSTGDPDMPDTTGSPGDPDMTDTAGRSGVDPDTPDTNGPAFDPDMSDTTS